MKPEHWGGKARLRFSNALGTQPVTFDGRKSVTVAPGESAWSDPVALPFVRKGSELRGRKLTVSFHADGASGPLTWHAKALQSSYVTVPGAGSKGHDEGEAAFPFATASWYFLDAMGMAIDLGLFGAVAPRRAACGDAMGRRAAGVP